MIWLELVVLRLYSSEFSNFYLRLVYIICSLYIKLLKWLSILYNSKNIVIDTVLAFEEPSYSLKLSYGRKGNVFKFKTIKSAHKPKEKNSNLEFEKQPENDKRPIKNEFSFKGNYSLEYVPGMLLIYSKLLNITTRVFFFLIL